MTIDKTASVQELGHSLDPDSVLIQEHSERSQPDIKLIIPAPQHCCKGSKYPFS